MNGVMAMARMNLKGCNEFIQKLENLTMHTEPIMKKALYVGAREIRKAVAEAAAGVPVQDEYVNKNEMRTGIRAEDKAKLMEGVGVAKHRNDGGSVNTAVGFRRGTAGIARKVESGTSYMQKHPFVRRATNRARRAAEAEMKKVFEEETQKLMK